MTIQNKEISVWLLAGIIILLLAVVFFIQFTPPPQNPTKTECEARFVSWCSNCLADNWPNSTLLPNEIESCMQLYNPLNMKLLKENSTCDYAKPLCNYYGVKGVTSNTTENSSLNQTGNNSCEIIEFYGAECPHCANMVPIVAQVESETGVNFVRLEIWHNTTNQNIFQQYNESIERDCGILGVPTFTSPKTNSSICGEMSESDLKYFVTSNCGKS